MTAAAAPGGGRGSGSGGWGAAAAVAPALILLIAFNVFPLFYNIILSFTSAELGVEGWSWVGTRNYQRVFERPEYAAALRTTALFVFLAVAIELALGFVLALALHRRFAGKTALLTALLIPMMLPPAVMGLYANLLYDGDYGLLNQILSGFGLVPPQWRTDPAWKLTAVLIVDVWMWTPFMLLISLAALGSVPRHLYEAAEVDRASAWMVFRRITIPLCAPLLALAALLRTTDALKQFDIVMAITGPNDQATQTVSALLYQGLFADGKVGRGSAYACVVLVLVIALATVCTRYLDWLGRRQGRDA